MWSDWWIFERLIIFIWCLNVCVPGDWVIGLELNNNVIVWPFCLYHEGLKFAWKALLAKMIGGCCRTI